MERLAAYEDTGLLPSEISQLMTTELAAVKRERDAAVKDCALTPCKSCVEWPHITEKCFGCNDNPKTTGRKKNHVWRGPCSKSAPEGNADA